MTNEGNDLAAVESCAKTMQELGRRSYDRIQTQDLRILELEQLVISLQLRVDSPAADSIDAVTGLANISGVHWLVVLHNHWDQSFDKTLQKCLTEYRGILTQREYEVDPHGAKNG